jgi:hypothetical protein
MEPIFHVACLTWGYVAVIIGLALDIFNPIATQNLRSFGVAPPGCNYIPEIECTRGRCYQEFGYALVLLW